jgi:RNA polymerase sigma factor (TIGR02999 family)
MELGIGPLMAAAEEGDEASRERLFATLYSELTRLARRELARGGPQLTLGAATLVHEFYLDVSGREGASFPDRARFMAYAARVMRGLIIDHARRRCAQKRGGQFEITSLRTDPGVAVIDDAELARVGEALDELARIDPALAQVVDLRFFCGLSFAEIADLNNISVRTAQRQWDKARIYLHTHLQADLVN